MTPVIRNIIRHLQALPKKKKINSHTHRISYISRVHNDFSLSLQCFSSFTYFFYNNALITSAVYLHCTLLQFLYQCELAFHFLYLRYSW